MVQDGLRVTWPRLDCLHIFFSFYFWALTVCGAGTKGEGTADREGEVRWCHIQTNRWAACFVLAVKFLIALPSLSLFFWLLLFIPAVLCYFYGFIIWFSGVDGGSGHQTSEAGGRRSIACCHLFVSFKYCPGPKAGTQRRIWPHRFLLVSTKIRFKNRNLFLG